MTAPRRPWTHEVRRISTAALKHELGPTRWRRTKAVRLETDGSATDVAIIDEPSATTRGGFRRFLRCPRCHSPRATVLGFVPGGIGWSCRTCARWVGRSGRRLGAAEHPEPAASAPA